MKWNNVQDFMEALGDRIDELQSEDAVTGSTSINEADFDEDELCTFDAIAEEARALGDTDAETTAIAHSRLFELGYSEDEITQILDYEGL